MKEVNEELESSSPRWDENLGRWVEPDESPEELQIVQLPTINDEPLIQLK
jgi:hypothetical protein